MTGYFEACKEFKFKNGGGDVRQGPSLAIRVFGVGTLNGHRKIGRSGAVRGDRLVAIGDTGTFMATYLLANHNELSIIRDGKLSPTAEPTLKWPKPQLRAMTALASSDLVSAAHRILPTVCWEQLEQSLQHLAGAIVSSPARTLV
jgi:thiamine-monophosphate kinase